MDRESILESRRLSRRFWIILLSLVSCLLAGGYWFAEEDRRQIRDSVEDNLLSIARLKVDAIVEWRTVLWGDAQFLRESAFLQETFDSWRTGSESRSAEKIAMRLQAYRKHYRALCFWIVEENGRVLGKITEADTQIGSVSEEISEDRKALVKTAFQRESPLLSDLHRDNPGAGPCIDMVVPMGKGEARFALIFSIACADRLYPLLRSWPVPSESAESLLVRRDGDGVLFLNDLRFEKDTALRRRIPLSQTDVLAVKAVLGERGIAEGIDYRGVEVLSALAQIPDSPWFLVAKIDSREVFEPLRARMMFVLASTAWLVLLAGIVVAFLWVQSQRRQELAFWESKAAMGIRLRSTLRSIGDAVISTDLRGLVTDMNGVAEELTDWREEEARGRPLAEIFRIVQAQTRRTAEDPVEKALKTGRIVGLANHTVLISRRGQEYQIADSAAPIRDAYGEVTGVVLVFRDVTEAYRMREQLERMNETLEQQVAERTAQLEATNKELNAFTYSVSHDLRAPLRSIDGFSNALLEEYEGRLDEEGRDCLHRIRNAAQRMGKLIDGLLGLSRIGQSEMKFARVDLTAMAHEIALELRNSEAERCVEFAIQENLSAEGESGLLRAVLENLLGNAWKFTSRRSEAHIEFGSSEQDGQTVYFVRDDGAGFDMAYADKLFGVFQRLHDGHEFPGTGIGLATVQRIVHRHGGKIWAEGAVGKSAAFYFTIPTTHRTKNADS